MGLLLCGFTDGPVASSTVLGWMLAGPSSCMFICEDSVMTQGNTKVEHEKY